MSPFVQVLIPIEGIEFLFCDQAEYGSLPLEAGKCQVGVLEVSYSRREGMCHHPSLQVSHSLSVVLCSMVWQGRVHTLESGCFQFMSLLSYLTV